MCCRYWAGDSPEIRGIAEEMNRSPLVEKWRKITDITTRGEIRPTNVVPVVASRRSGERAVFPMKWGFSGRTLLMNARVETASARATFKDAWAAHRCIVPASWYFEWEHIVGQDGKRRTGDKYRICPKGGSTTWLCGLYRIENGLPAFVVLTREASAGIRFIHDRMPLILPEDRVGAWIRPDSRPAQLALEALTEMVCEKVASETSIARGDVQMRIL